MIPTPTMKAARKVIIPITVTNARPAIESAGTSGILRFSAPPEAASLREARIPKIRRASLFIGLQTSVGDDEPTRAVESIHQCKIMRGDHHGGA